MKIDLKQIKEVVWPHRVELKDYDYDTKQTVSRGLVELHLLRKALDEGTFAELLDGFVNSYDHVNIRSGVIIGRSIAEHSHLTVVSSVVRLCLGILYGIGYYAEGRVDGRNERAVESCRKIIQQVEYGDLGADFI